ncbi:MAG: cache domain-containing protein [Acidobacteria bacterium]|nr:cache domain-containing protein [Acidobacteriota bacterium]
MSMFGLGNLSSGWRVSARLVVAILVPAAIVGWLLVNGASQKRALEERNMRWLGHMANQIEARISNFDEAVDRWAYIGAKEKTNSASVAANKFGVVNNLDTEDCPAGGTNFSVTKEAGKLKLHFRRTKNGDACAYSDLGKVVEQSLRKDVFSAVILAERNGTVLYQTDQAKMRFTDLDFLFKAAPAKEAPSPAKSDAAPKASVPAGPGQHVPTASTHSIKSIGDQEYSVYVQPLRLRLSAANDTGQGDWFLVGLSEANTPWESSGPQGLLLVLPLVVLLVALSWPLPRLWLMSSAEPLRQGYLVIAAACSMGIVLVMTILGLYFFIRSFADVRTDGRLAILAEEIGSNVSHELKLALKQLEILDKRAYDKRLETEEGDSSAVRLLSVLKPNEIVFPFEYADWINANGQKDFRWTTSKEPARPITVSDRQYFRNVMEDHLLPPLTAGAGPFAVERVLSRTTGRMVTMLAVRSKLDQEQVKEQRLPVANLAVTLPSLESPVLPAEFGFAVIDSAGKVLFHSEPSRVMVENLFEECPEVPELAQVVERRATASISTNYSGGAHRMLVAPLPGLGQVPWTLVVYRKLEPVRVVRAQAMVGALALFVCYSVAVLVIAGGVLYLLGRWRRRFMPALLLEAAWWAPHGSCYPVLAAFGFALMLIYWRSLDGATGSVTFYSSIAVAVSFLTLSAVALRIPLTRPWRGISLVWLVTASAWLAAFAWMMNDYWMVVFAPAGLAAARYAQYRWRGRGTGPAWRTPRSWVLWAAELVVCLVILPTFGLGKMSYEYEAGLYARELQSELSEGFTQQGEALAQRLAELPGATECRLVRQQLLSALRIGAVTTSTCAPTYFYGGAGYNTQITIAAAQRHLDKGEQLAQEERIRKEREDSYNARREAAARRSPEAYQQVDQSIRAEQQQAAAAKLIETKIAAEAARLVRASETSAAAWKEEVKAIEAEKRQADAARLARAAAKSGSARLEEAKAIAGERAREESARIAYVKRMQGEQEQTCPLAPWKTETQLGWREGELTGLFQPKAVETGASCADEGGLLDDAVFIGSDTSQSQPKAPQRLFDEEPPAIQRALNKFPILVLALVELPFDARQEGFEMRLNQLQPGGSPPPWEWRVQGAENGTHYLWLAQDSGKDDYQAIARSKLPAFIPWNLFSAGLWTDPDKLPTLWMGIEFWLGMIAAVVAFLWWGRAFRQRVRLDDLQMPASIPLYQPATVWQGRFLIHISPGYPDAPLLGYWAKHSRIDLASVDVSSPPALPEGGILITNLQSCLATASQRKMCLDLIEGAMRTPSRSVVVTTSIEPLSYLQSGGAGAAGEPADTAELSRWKRITHSLESRRMDPPEGVAPPEDDAVWMSCSVHEKAILTYLDRHKLVAPTAGPVAARLLGRGLLRRRPDGRIEFASPPFQRFVSALQEAPDEALLASQSASKGISPWAIGIVLVGVVLFFSQEELTSRLLGFLTSVGAGLEVLRKHLTASSASSGGASGSAKG